MQASFGNTLEELRHRAERLHAERYNAQLIPTPEYKKMSDDSWKHPIRRRNQYGNEEITHPPLPPQYSPITEDYKERMRRLTANVVLTLGVESASSEPGWSREQLYPEGSTGYADTRFYLFDLGGGYGLRVSWQNFRLDATNSIEAELVGTVKIKRSYVKKGILRIKTVVDYEDEERLESLPIIVQDNEGADVKSLSHFPQEEREKLRTTILAMYWSLNKRFG